MRNLDAIFNISKYTNRRRELRQGSTVAERCFWNAVKNKQLGIKFRRQASIGHYIVDFHCVEKAIVIEIDGEIHSSSEAQAYDRERDIYLEAVGLKVIRFTNEEIIRDLETVLSKVVTMCDALGKMSPP